MDRCEAENPGGPDLGGRAWAAALALVGVRFRLHGRDPASGLDCVGLVAAAYRAAGHAPVAVPDRYRLAGPGVAAARAWLIASGLVPVAAADAPRAGDVALAEMAADAPLRSQLHVLLLGPGGAIHAHAGLGKVVLMPGAAPWGAGHLIGRWRVPFAFGEEQWRR